MSSIGALCNRLRKTFLRFLLGNLGATVRVRVNSSPVKVKLIIFPLFLPERSAILPMAAKEACELREYVHHYTIFQYLKSAFRII